MNQTQSVTLSSVGPIPPDRERFRPSIVFEKELDQWQRMRGHDLHDQPVGAYAYFIKEVNEKMAATDALYMQAEKTRAAIRAGADPNNVLIDAENVPPDHYLTMVATWFGWRLVPLARKYATERHDSNAAKRFEDDVCAWLAWADAVWDALEMAPPGTTSRVSFASWIDPLRRGATRICKEVYDWVGAET